MEPATISIFNFAWLIPLFPLLAFLVITLFTHHNRTLSQQLAMYGIVIACVLAQMVFWSNIVAAQEGAPIFRSPAPVRWLTLAGDRVSLGVTIDPTSALMLFILSIVSLTSFIYGLSVARGPDAARNGERHSRFFAALSLLTAGTLGVLVFDNLLAFVICWALSDVAAYLLIDLWRRQAEAVQAALKMFLINQAGNLALLLGLAMLHTATQTLAYQPLFSADSLQALSQRTLAGTDWPIAPVVALMLFIGVAAKGALIPLHIWLVDAKQAPASGSALIHTTFTASGIFLLIRAYPLFQAASEGLTIPRLGWNVIVLVGVLTAIFAALVGVVQRDLRSAVTYAAISQMGFAIAALGTGAFAAGVFHLGASVFSNALLLLAAGSISHGLSANGAADPNDMLAMGGLAGRQPLAFWGFFIGAIAWGGFPFLTAGFWSRDAVLGYAWIHAQPVFWLLTLAGGVMAFAAMRLICLIFIGGPRSEAAGGAPRSAPSMRGSLLILILLVLFGGWAALPEGLPILEENWLANFIGARASTVGFSWDPTSLSLAISVFGLLSAFLTYAWRPLERDEPDRLTSAATALHLSWLHHGLQRGLWLDRLYGAGARGTTALARLLDVLDRRALNPIAPALASLSQRLANAVASLDERLLARSSSELAQASVWLASAIDQVDRSLARAPATLGRGTRRLATSVAALERALARLIGLIGPATNLLGRLGLTIERGLNRMVDAIGRSAKAGGRWLRRPTSTDGYDDLLLTAVAALALIALFLLAF